MPARRCSIGCESWPDNPIFTLCLHCREATDRVADIEPTIEFEEARSLVLHDLFERFYVRHCAQQGIAGDGPLT